MDKQPQSFEKEEVKCDNSGASFFACAKEDKSRAVQEAISALMKWYGTEMRDSVKAAAKGARAGFTEAVNAAVEEAVSKVRAE